MSRPDRITLRADEGEAILARLAVYAPSRADCEILSQVLRLYMWLMMALEEAKVSIRRLRALLFGSRRTAKEPCASEASMSSREACGEGAGGDEWARCAAVPVGASTIAPPAKAKGGHQPGTGRLGAAAYAGATRVECRHEELAVGQRCPVCGQGNLYALPAGVEIRIDGNALLSALRYELEKLRCSACGEIFTAGLPAGVGKEKYSAQARAALAMSRYYLGVPG